MKTLITGATGFVGAAVLRQLLDRGHDVRALVRKTSDLRNLKGLEVETCTGDLNDTESLNLALQGCNALFHIAADYRIWAPNPDEMVRNNLSGSKNLMTAALAAGIERIVYTSSVATLGLLPGGAPADEATLSSLETMVGAYKRSKFLAEQEVQRLINEENLPAVIVNPSAPIGPRDIKPTPTGRMVLQAAKGAMPAYVETGLNVVHVDDVAAGHILAYEKGEIGERYILGGENMTLKKILILIAEITGGRPPKFSIP
ncbi:MAG: NAD-dependent epimerase/dehydratase family protein, partial [Rhodospirillales bacterium]|nr:NAD-dependent epimerase/dehydratase family protein [Rhodospirillales bacterium]